MTQPETPSPSPAPSPTEDGRGGANRRVLRTVVRTIGRDLDDPESWAIPRGDVAALRRSRPGTIGGPAFWKIAVRYLEPAGLLPAASAPWRPELERRWTTLLGGMAETAGRHSGGVPFGRALAGRSELERPVSEHRVLRLLEAHGEALLALVRPIAHLLASRGARVDWTDCADLLLGDGTPWEDRARRQIALDYYKHLSR